ncbi:MAG: hypothetical protein RLZZ230_867 [Candidatus Parcubacteria bacterium]|jgi:hypothetical protein
MLRKFKSFIADDAIFTALLLIMVGVISFGLGRQSATESSINGLNKSSAGVIFTESPFSNPIQKTNPVASSTETTAVKIPTSGQLVASRSGTKYHLTSCPGAKQIKEANKIYFDTVDKARAAGYTPASNCPGLQ